MNNYSGNPVRGEIYYIERIPAQTVGSEQQYGRPAVIVSNDMCNTYSTTVEVVYLTTQPKNDLPTHVTIRSSTKPSIALCEQIHTIDVKRLGDYVAICTESEMNAIDAALMISLGIDTVEPKEKIVEVVKEVEIVKEVPVEVVKEVPAAADNSQELIETREKLAMLQTMYDDLLHRITANH